MRVVGSTALATSVTELFLLELSLLAVLDKTGGGDGLQSVLPAFEKKAAGTER